MVVRPLRLVCWLLGLFLTSADARAFSPAPPRRHDVFSPNGAFVLDVDPDRATNTVHAANDRGRPLWSFPGRVWLSHVLLSNDGAVVTVVGGKYIRDEDVTDAVGVRFLNQNGVFKTYTVSELCPNPKRTQDVGPGPIGEFWRTWYTDVTNDGEQFVLYTTGRYDHEFRFSDGKLTGSSRLWVNLSRRTIEENLLPFGLAFLCGLLMLLLAFGYWKRRREMRRPQTVISSPEDKTGNDRLA